MADSKTVRFLEGLYARVDRQVREIVASMLPEVNVAAQDDGVVITNQWRILNFQGSGVSVIDDPALRRTNLFFPGSPVSSASTSYYSLLGNRALNLWNGSSNNAPPADWFRASFNHTTWAVGVQEPAGGHPISGADDVTPPGPFTSPTYGLLSDILTWQTFTLPAGSPASVTLQVAIDSTLVAIYVNEHLVTDPAHPYPYNFNPSSITPISMPVPVSWLLPGGTNSVAVWARNDNTDVTVIDVGAAWKVTVGMDSAGADARYQLLAEKNVASGYAGLDAGVRVPTARLGSGSASDSTFLRGDQTWAAASTNSVTVQEVDTSPSIAATVIEFPNGTLSNPSGSVVRYTPSAGAQPVVIVQDQKSANTAGGTFTSGADRTRDINTEVVDTDGLASIASNQVTLQAGTWECFIVVPAYHVDAHKAHLYNVTGSAVLVPGMSSVASSADSTGTVSIIIGRFTLGTASALEIRHRCATTKTTDGFGWPTNFGVSEIYTTARFEKVG